MLSTMFEKASLRATELPVVSKAHDDLFLTCVAHRRTLLLAKRVDRLTVLAALPVSPSANAPVPTAIAALRASSLKCGTGPTQTRRLCARSSFFQTSTRTSRPAKACHRGGPSACCAHVTSRYACLAPVECMRNADGLSFVCVQNYVYILVRGGRAPPPPPSRLSDIARSPQARTDPSFKVGRSALGMQVFCNPVTHVPNPSPDDMADAQQAATELPTHACSVNTDDGYRPEATLFVDEDWLALRTSRENKMGQMIFRPVVR